MYITDEILELEGELIEVLWKDPHTRDRLSVVNDTGEETVWEVELGPGSNSMARRGLAAEDFLGHVRVAGHSTGRWDVDTLVVNTSHIGRPYYTEIGMPQSDQATYVEHFSLSDGGNRLDYSIVIDDRVVLNEPFTLESFREWTPGIDILPYNCVINWGNLAD